MKELMARVLSGSWKTTSAGILLIVGAVVDMGFALKSGGLAKADIMGAATAICGGLGLIFARDNDKSSEDVGTK